MRLLKVDRYLIFGMPAMIAALATLGVLLIGESRPVSAQSPLLAECRVVVALDKSPSIGAANLATLRTNIIDLIERLYAPNIHLAFWAFSHSDDHASDYNLPRHDYITTTADGVELMEFEDSLPTAAQLEGQTDYAQAYGFTAGDPDINAINRVEDITLTSNTRFDNTSGTKIDDIRSRADVVVLLTDGAPNYPGGSDNNAAARYAGRAARLQYPASVTMVGGYITDSPNFDPVSLKYTINGSDSDGTRVGPVSYDGAGGTTQIYSYVKDRILEICNADRSDYWLVPKTNVTSSATAVQEDDIVSFGYQVDKDKDEAIDRQSSWQIYDVIMNKDVPVDVLNFSRPGSACTNNSGEPYCDFVTNCTVIMAKIGGKGKCDPVSAANRGSGTDTFTGGQNLFYGNPRDVVVGDYEFGTRVCSVLVLSVASATGAVNRSSSADCVTVGKSPLVQVHGGDIRVGRHFSDDETNQGDGAGVYTSSFKISKGAAIAPGSRTFGSWVEYGVLAPGPIEKIASLSGFAGEHGGYDNLVGSSSCNKIINKLTFANKVSDTAHSSECGYYSRDLGSIPDVVSALTSGPVIPATSLTIGATSLDNNNGQRYEDAAADATFSINESKLVKGKTYVVHVPHGTVTINGNITYDNPADRYDKISDIPQLVIIAKNINISHSVTQVNAWLIAAGDSDEEVSDDQGGILDTCTGYAPPFSSKVCNQPLRVNGPVMARDLHLWRTLVKEDSCTIEVIEDCADAGNPAETMNLTGSSLLWTQGYNQNSARARTTSTIELPPYF